MTSVSEQPSAMRGVVRGHFLHKPDFVADPGPSSQAFDVWVSQVGCSLRLLPLGSGRRSVAMEGKLLSCSRHGPPAL